MREMLKLQAKLEDKLTDQEGRARQENIRIDGIEVGSESNSISMITFVENLLREKLELPPTHDLRIERVHRALGPKPPAESPLRSIVVKFSSSKTKEEIPKLVWRKKGFLFLWITTMHWRPSRSAVKQKKTNKKLNNYYRETCLG